MTTKQLIKYTGNEWKHNQQTKHEYDLSSRGKAHFRMIFLIKSHELASKIVGQLLYYEIEKKSFQFLRPYDADFIFGYLFLALWPDPCDTDLEPKLEIVRFHYRLRNDILGRQVFIDLRVV